MIRTSILFLPISSTRDFPAWDVKHWIPVFKVALLFSVKPIKGGLVWVIMLAFGMKSEI